MGEVLGSLLGAWFVLAWVVALVLTFSVGIFYPLMVWSITRNIKGIRVELERLNLLVASSGAPFVRADRGEDRAVRYETRTGSLGRL